MRKFPSRSNLLRAAYEYELVAAQHAADHDHLNAAVLRAKALGFRDEASALQNARNPGHLVVVARTRRERMNRIHSYIAGRTRRHQDAMDCRLHPRNPEK